jgi:hypothetical protein
MLMSDEGVGDAEVLDAADGSSSAAGEDEMGKSHTVPRLLASPASTLSPLTVSV